MAKSKKPVIDYDVVDNATDDQVRALFIQYSRGDEDAKKAVKLYDEAARKGDKSAIKLINRLADMIATNNAALAAGIAAEDPEALEIQRQILQHYEEGNLTPGEVIYMQNYTNPAEADLDAFISAVISEPTAAADFLEHLTAGKVKKLLPSHEVTPQEAADLTYTKEERATLRSGSDEEKEAAKASRRERARHFLSGLRTGEFITLLKAGASKTKKQPERIPTGTALSVEDYVTTKDLLTKAVFGEPGRNGKALSLVREEPGALTLWTNGRGKNKKDVIVYTRLDFDREALKAAGITVGKNLSKCAREVFGAILSEALAGNMVMTLGMVGELIYNTRADNLTDAQKKYIIDGATEVFLTTQYMDTTKAKEGALTLNELQNIKITDSGQLFPGHITTVEINGNVAAGIEVYSLPLLYTLQNALEKGQILRAPTEILKIPGRTDEDVITIRAYLLRRVDAMKHSGSLSRMIIFKNILAEVGIDPTDRAQRTRKNRILSKVERVLDYWKEEGYIHDYSKLTKTGKQVKGTASIYEIEIML